MMADAAAAGPAGAGDVKRRKQAKKMTKIIAKAWGLPGADLFQEAPHSSRECPRDLTTMGQKLDAGGYPVGRHGWERFAGDIGGVYNRHIASKGKHAAAAKRQLEDVKSFLAKVDPQLAEVASKSVPTDPHDSNKNKKRKHSANGNGSVGDHIPKKKHHADRDSSAGTGGTLTISQREKKAMEQLRNYLVEVGGAREQADGFRCKVVAQSSGDKFNTYFFTAENQRLKSMIDVARFLTLVRDDRAGSSHSSKKKTSGGNSKKGGTGRPSNQRQLDAEQRKLRKELDKLMKAHGKATKALDDHRNDHKNDLYPIEDDVLMEEEGEKLCHLPPRKPDIDGFPGIPPSCTPDLLMVWDFLCTFSRALSLEPIKLDDFAAALTIDPKPPPEDQSACPPSPPLYLAEAHLALLRLLLGDPTSDDWWWSTLETEEAESQEMDKGNKAKADDPLKPVVKVNLAALLAVEEDSEITARWLQALEDVRTKKPNSGVPIKSSVKSAMSVTKNPLVKSYLKKAMRKWRGNSAGFTKRAVVWLVDRVREARPDLWGRNVSKEEIEEQKAKVARDAALVMDQVDENADVDNVNEYNSEGESEDESESEEEEYFDDEDEDYELDGSAPDDGIASTNVRQDDETKPVTTPIPVKPPPALVDLLLPPQKLPVLTIISPFTWPSLSGATALRVLHYYKRRRNQVDDNLREFRELPPLSVAERRRREGLAPHRVLTECMSISVNDEDNPVEAAMSHLCSGRNYLDMSPVQKLCILRVLVEAAYDTARVSQCVEDNIKARINAGKALDVEERRAKREAREEASAAEAAARERLSKDARDAFLQKKRREIVRVNKITNEFTPEYIEGLTDDDLAEFDEDTKAEYEALPAPQSFNKSEVNAMVAKIHEEEAFNTHAVLILTMEEIEVREKEILGEMEEELASFGDIDSLYQHADRETTAKIDQLKKEISNMKDNLQSLPPARAVAVDALKDAMEDGTVKALKNAIRSANAALLTGVDEETDGVWALDLLRDAALELRSAERRKRVIEAQKDMVAKLNKCFVRTEPIGRDRFRNGFWHFDYDEEGRVWVDTNYILKKSSDGWTEGRISTDDQKLVLDIESAQIGAKDEEEDFCPECLLGDEQEKMLHFCRQEYHASGLIPALVQHHLGCHATDKSLRSLVKNLDSRGLRDSALKAKLKEILQSHEARDGLTREAERSGADAEQAAYKTNGDEDHFRNAKLLEQYKQGSPDGLIAFELLQDMNSAIGQRIRLRRVVDPDSCPDAAEYEMGTVVGWKLQEEPQENGVVADNESDQKPSGGSKPVWRIIFDKGGESQLLGIDLLGGLSRFLKWRRQHHGYVEEDGPLFAYRNSLGRFCGRAVDAPYSSSPTFFARLMLKREQEFYMPLKNRSYNENNWGGKSGARNAWMTFMKECGHEFHSVRDGLLTLENAFFELSGGLPHNNGLQAGVQAEVDTRSGRELLQDEKYRFDIELESIGQVRGLWNSSEARKIFREIVSSSKTVGFLALGLDLVCRNCQVYLDATKPTVTRNSYVEQPVGTRRMNAWQQQHADQYY